MSLAAASSTSAVVTFVASGISSLTRATSTAWMSAMMPELFGPMAPRKLRTGAAAAAVLEEEEEDEDDELDGEDEQKMA